MRLHVCKHGEKSSIAFIKYFSKISQQVKENVVFLTSSLKQIFLIVNDLFIYFSNTSPPSV